MILGDFCLKEAPHAEVTLIAIVRIFIWVVTMAAPFYNQTTYFTTSLSFAFTPRERSE